jgi:hypothetical protein
MGACALMMLAEAVCAVTTLRCCPRRHAVGRCGRGMDSVAAAIRVVIVVAQGGGLWRLGGRTTCRGRGALRTRLLLLIGYCCNSWRAGRVTDDAIGRGSAQS